MPDETFDVFLSHNSKDKPVVRQIAEALRDGRSLKVWLDEWELPPGRPWQDELDKIIRTVRSAAVLVGKDGLGPWEIPEMRACLSQMVKRGLLVIPVLLPDAPKAPDLPVFLAENTWVDLRGGLTEEGLDRLEWGITGEKPNRTTEKTLSTGPRLHNLPYPSLGNLLKGRDEDLRSLETGQAIYGLGGIGKTRLVVEYAWRSGNRYETVLFVVADSPEALRSSLAKLAGPGLLDLSEYETGVEAKTIAAVLRCLRERDRWLLILDNVDTPEAQEAVMEVLPALSSGRVLITSRLRDWAASVPSQELGILSLDEAQRFLMERTAKHRTPGGHDEEDACSLAAELGRLPLILEQAAAYITHHQITFADYLKAWEKERAEVLTWHNKNIMQYPASVAATWKTTLRQLSPTATAILNLAAYIAPDPIPVEMFKAGEELVKKSVRLFNSSFFVNAKIQPIKVALAELASYSMVTREGTTFMVHPIVQEVLRFTMPKKRAWIELSLQIVDAFAPSDADDVRTWPIWDSIRSHVLLVLQLAENHEVHHPTAQLMSRVAMLLYSKGIYQQSELLARRSLNIAQNSFGSDQPSIGMYINNLAYILASFNPVEAEVLMRQALDIAERCLEPRYVAIALNNLGNLLSDMGREVEAEHLLVRALEVTESVFGPLHSEVAVCLSNLALVFRKNGRWEEGFKLSGRALQIQKESFGLQHPNVAIATSNYSLFLEDSGQIAKAISFTIFALQIFEENLGCDHPHTKVTSERLSSLLHRAPPETPPPPSPNGAPA